MEDVNEVPYIELAREFGLRFIAGSVEGHREALIGFGMACFRRGEASAAGTRVEEACDED